jgi:uncharacterized protein YndB with AHSA1/START domain
MVSAMNTAFRRNLLAFAAVFTVACGPSLATMHEGAMAGRVQEGAPLHARQTVTIAAPRARVYALLADFAAWPTWQPKVTSVVAPKSLEPGATFTWVNGGSTITSKLAVVKPNERLAWTGSVATAKAVHSWRLSSPTEGTTQVDVEETMDGFLLTWFYGQKELDAEMARTLKDLKTAAER